LRVDDEKTAGRFLREAKTMSLFQHPNIVELVEVGKLDDGTLFFAAELVRGITLRELLASGVVEPARALAITRQILGALGHAHAMGVVHRDIKPENVMLADGGGPDGDLVKILDFGVAKLIGDTPAVLGEGTLTITGYGALGTPYYMSPEAVLGRPLDARADVYSIGAMLFELLTGKPPYAHEDVATLMRMHAAAPIPTLKDRAPDREFSPELELVISEALAKKPDMRFKSSAEMIEAVDAASRSLASAVDAGWNDEPPKTTKSTDVFGAYPLKPPANRVSLPGLPPMPGAPEPAPPAPLPVIQPPPVFESAPLFAPPMPTHPPKQAPQWLAKVKQYKRIIAIGGGVIALIVIVAIIASGGSKKSAKTPTATPTVTKKNDLAQRAQELITAGHPSRAAELIEREDIGDDADAWVVLGHARIGSGRRLDGLAAYQQAIKLDKKLAADPQIRTNVARVLDTRDAPAGVLALELAMRLDPPAQDVIKLTAGSGKVGEVRRWAYAIAEREKFADGIDRVGSWSLDLAQAANCEERLAAVLKLRRVADPRAIPALKRARTYRCVEREVAEAIAYLESRPANP
jgi:serine/threonine protein kinase